MRILVTGATGNIGTELVHLLSIDPSVDEVRAATRSPDGEAARLLGDLAPDRVRPVALDPDRDGTLDAALNGAEANFHIR